MLNKCRERRINGVNVELLATNVELLNKEADETIKKLHFEKRLIEMEFILFLNL